MAFRIGGIKMKEIKNFLLKNFFSIALFVFVIVAMLDILYLPAIRFLSNTSAVALANLSLATGMKILIAGIPVLKGSAEIIDKVFSYLVFINGVLFFQIILLKVSQILLLKLLILASWILLFFRETKKLALKALLVLFLFNPGLSFYLAGAEYISNAVRLESGELIKAHMESIDKEKLKEKGKVSVEEEKKSENKSIFVVIGDFLINTFNTIKNTIIDAINKTKAFVGESILRLLELTINYFISVLFLFLICPFLYFILLYLLMKNIFAKLNEEEIEIGKGNKGKYILIPLERNRFILRRWM